MARLRNNIHIKNLAFLAFHLIIIAVEAQLLTARNRFLKDSTRSNDAIQATHGTVFNIEKYGAVGDGAHDNTEAFTQAWNDACKAASGTLLVPSGKTFLLNNLIFQGPCQPGFIFQVDGTIVAPEAPSSWKSKYAWLQFQHLESFTLTGSGTIDGKGNTWWEDQCKTVNGRKSCGKGDRPAALVFNDMKGMALTGLSVINSPKFHITFSNSDTIQIVGITIQAPGSSPNTDGIDTFASSNIVIKDSVIGTGDDCVGIGDGSSNVKISGVTCGPGHGISIGSLGKGNTVAHVESVSVENVKLKSTTNGLRIKTWQGGSGTARDITYQNVQMEDVSNPIIINQYYCDSQSDAVCKNQSSAVQISNVTYKDITGTSATEAGITLSCSESGSCTGITLENISLKQDSGAPASANCANVKGRSIGNVSPSDCLG